MPVEPDEFIYNFKTGECAVLKDGRKLKPVSAKVEQTYERENKGPKIINRSPIDPNVLYANPSRALESYDIFYAIDTNTRFIGNKKISVTGVVAGMHTQVIIEKHTSVHFHPVVCIEMRNVEGKAELVGWVEAFDGIKGSLNYKRNRSIAIIVDSELDRLEEYNSRSIPIYGNHYLPDKFTLLYAGDKHTDNLQNKLLATAEKYSKMIMKKIPTVDNKQYPLVSVDNSEKPFSHMRSWRF